MSAASTPHNDITSLTAGTITFQGTGSFTFKLTGNAISVAGGIVTGSIFPTIDLGLTLSASQSMTGSGLNLGDQNTTPTLNLNGHNLTIGSGSDQPFVSLYDAVSGSGNISAQNNADVLLLTASSGWNGNLNISNGGVAQVFTAGALGASGNTVTITSGGLMSLCGLNGATVPQNITLGGNGVNSSGALDANTGCNQGGSNGSTAAAKVTLSGSITLTSNTTVYSADATTITGPLSGNFTITPVTGMTGTLVISSSNNTSLTPNGTSQAAATTVTYGDNSPSTGVDIPFNVTGIVDGSYGTTTVDKGGILKGTGTMTQLQVNSGAVMAPGHSPGCLTVTGTMNEGGTYQAELGGTTACTGYDQIIVNGSVVLDDASVPPSQSILQVSLVSGFKPAVGQTFEIINNKGTGAVQDTFSKLPEGSTFSVSGYVFKIPTRVAMSTMS